MPQPSVQPPRPACRGFTMIELMVVMGILIIIVGLVLPALLKSRKTGFVIRQKSDLALIETALEAYKADFGDYPRFADPASEVATAGNPGSGTWLDYSPSRGAQLLCFALISPGPESDPNHTGSYTLAMPGEDGANGPGFRIRRNPTGSTNQLTGKIYGPYLDSSKFKIKSSMLDFQDAVLLDIYGNPILYYPARLGSPVVSAPNSYDAEVKIDNSFTAGTTLPLYNPFDNEALWPTANANVPQPVPNFQLMMGDGNYVPGGTVANNTGAIDSATKTAATTIPYLLWTAGADGQFGVDANGKSDDVCNFDYPQNLRK
jgi:prepilin-type N-terminal cleavage/methylation domain-containing protein